MVHALQEAWRVLKPSAILIDIRPAVAHSQVGVQHAGCFTLVGPSAYSIAMYQNASRALHELCSTGRFRQRSSTHFLCLTFSSSLKQLQDWLTDSDSPLSQRKTELLLHRAAHLQRLTYPNGKVAVRERIYLRVLEKIG